jgi:hypothetical protein
MTYQPAYPDNLLARSCRSIGMGQPKFSHEPYPLSTTATFSSQFAFGLVRCAKFQNVIFLLSPGVILLILGASFPG